METKTCTKCGKEKPIDDFHWRNKEKGIKRSDCKECHNKYMSKHYSDNKEKLNSEKILIGCAKCGYNKCAAALEYHHIDASTKIDTVARLCTHSSPKDFEKEKEKCILLCANCHREFHFLQEKDNITLKQFIEN